MRYLSFVCSCCLFLISTSAGAAIVTAYDNFGPGDSFLNSAWDIGGGDADIQIGHTFTPTQSGFLTDLYVAASVINDVTGNRNIMFELFSDATGVPGLVLETFLFTELPDISVDLTSGSQHVTASGTTFLDSTLSYWLVASALDPRDTLGWNISSTETAPTYVTKFASSADWVIGSSSSKGAFRVQVSTVPIPAAVWLFGSGLVGLIAVARRRKAA
jgi:hypothetical protein